MAVLSSKGCEEVVGKEEGPHCHLTWLGRPAGPRGSAPGALSHPIEQEHPQPPPAMESPCAGRPAGVRGHRACVTCLPVLCCRRELRLRNYVPEDEALKKRRVPQAKPVAGGSAEPPCLRSVATVNGRTLRGVALSEND